ncbi:MAG: translocation/assembly module TamB domain-containing protein, partial [Armatimonadetes bacterium]|nr:translocation/assembly module TamB domain-containing protein [Armatimonadota bacterium]
TYLRLGGLLHGEADVRGGIVGTMDAPRLVGHVAARAGRLGPLTFDLLRGEVEFGAQGIGARGVTVVDGATFLRMDGTAEWGAGGALDLTVRADNLPVSRLSQYARVTIPVEGDIAGRLHLGGRIDDPRVAGEVSLSRARVLGQRVDQVTARFRYTGDRLTVDEAVARVNSSTVRASGTLDAQTLTLDFSAQAFRLEDLRLLTEGPLVARGPVDLTGQIRGTPLRPDVRGRVTAGPITLNGQTFTGVEGQVQWRDGLLVLDPLNLERNRERYHLAGRLERTPGGDGTQRVTLSATVEDGRLSTLVGLTRTDLPVKMEGLVRGSLTLQGPIESPTGRLDLRVTDGTLGTLPVSDARLNVGWQGQAFTIDTLEVRAGRGLLAAKGRLDMRGETLIEVSGTDLDVEVLQSLLRGAPRMAGTANFTAQLTGRSADPQLGLSLEVRNGSVRDTGFDNLIAQAFHQRGVLTIEQAMLVRGEHRVRVDGQIPIDLFTMRFHERQPLALRANLVDADLSMLRLFTDRVAEARGRVEGQVTVSGTVANPHMAGLLRASGGFLRLTGISPAFEEVQGEIVFTENRADVRGVSARIGGGAVRVAGQTTVSEFRPDRLDIRVDVERASVAVPPYFSGRVDASAQLVGTARQPVLRGAVTLSRGDLRVASLGEAGKAVTAGSPAGRQPSLALDLRVQAGQELWVNLGQLRVEIDGSLHVGGTPSRPLLAGQIQTHEGRFSYLGGLFILEEGSATFAEFRGLIPYVTARAQTTVGNARIRIEAEGTPDDLNVQLSSEPVMSRQEIVTLLARQAGYEYLLRGDIEGAVRAELSRLLFGRFEQAVIRSFGLSEFRLSYDFARPLELRIGKYLLRNLYVTFATTFGPDPANLWSLEYRFTPSTALGLTLDHLGRYGILLSHVIRY